MIKYFAKGSIKKVLKGEADFINREIEILIKKEWVECDTEISEAINSISIGGVKGDKGDKGDTGNTGQQGIQGIKGDTGDIGPQGLKGDTGDTGIQGSKGDTGEQGIQGIQGPAGSDANVTKANVEAVLTGEINTHSHAGSGGGTIVFLGDI